MAGRRRIRQINEGDFLQVIVSKNTTLRLWPPKDKGSVMIFDLVAGFHVNQKHKLSP
jgi:hypothetical protein